MSVTGHISPIYLMVADIKMKHLEDGAVVAFRLTIGIREVRAGELVSDPHNLTHPSEEFRHKLRSLIGWSGFRTPVF